MLLWCVCDGNHMSVSYIRDSTEFDYQAVGRETCSTAAASVLHEGHFPKIVGGLVDCQPHHAIGGVTSALAWHTFYDVSAFFLSMFTSYGSIVLLLVTAVKSVTNTYCVAGWSHVAGAASSEGCAVIYLILSCWLCKCILLLKQKGSQ